MSDMEQQIRERAYQIWEEQGRPHGREIENWLEAERSVRAQVEATAQDARADDAEDETTGPNAG